MSKDLNSLFEALREQYALTLTQLGNDSIKKARDKTYAKDRFLSRLTDIARAYLRGAEKNKTASQYFTEKYYAGENLETITSHISQHHPDALHIEPIAKGRDTAEYIPFSEKETSLIRQLPAELQQLLTFYAARLTVTEVLQRFTSNTENQTPAKQTPSYPLEWTGTNKNEFVQLVYGLFKAGLINKGEGEITKIVESLAKALKVDLSDNWQSNHSSSIHRAKSSYKPEIFSKIQQAYLRYTEDQVEDKRKNK